MSDAPELPSGLARIGRDLACRVANELPQFRVGYYGRQGSGSRKFPFAQYGFAPTVEDQWGMRGLQRAWEDFAGDQRGIVFTIQDPSRMFWFTNPPAGMEWMNEGRFKRWGYVPVDSTGPGDKLSGICTAAMRGYDRLLAYTQFGAGVLSRSLGTPIDWLPHGIDLDVFQPRDRNAARIAAGWKPSNFVIGTVMTNQPRKDWGLAASIAAILKLKNPAVRFWWHVDTLERHWSIRALIEDYQLEENVRVTFDGMYTDEEMSYLYSACDLTMLPSLCEGFGFPIVESMACGVPCIHGNYGGGAELIPEGWRIDPQSWRLDTPYNCVRPVFDPQDWANKILHFPNQALGSNRSYVEHLHWPKLWESCWRKWFETGLGK